MRPRKPKFTDGRRGAAITVKVIPRAKRTEVAGFMDDGTVKIRVAAPPVEGAANKVLVSFLAETLSLPRNQIDIVAGETSERKLISLVGVDPAVVDATLRGLLAPRGDDEAAGE